MSFERLKCSDGRMRGLLADWERWLIKADNLYCRFLARIGDSPFLYHEVASVGFLASAAAMAGFIPLAEYEVVKRRAQDKRARVDGRADFWFCSDDRAYSFEFKRAHVAATPANLSETLTRAYHDIARIQRDEYHYAAGGLIARVRDEHRLETYLGFAEHDDVDLAYRIGPKGQDGAFLFFKLAG
jgi:hypothetical protein